MASNPLPRVGGHRLVVLRAFEGVPVRLHAYMLRSGPYGVGCVPHALQSVCQAGHRVEGALQAVIG
ncbi:protein of unknown function [Ralstonia solanacearum CFBP2957]|nr:protein of unknown function [Ralstonia solanacearum CFBP2957]